MIKKDFSKSPKIWQFNILVLFYAIFDMGRLNNATQNRLKDFFESKGYGKPIFDNEILKLFFDNKFFMQNFISEIINCDTHKETKALIDEKLYPIIKQLFEAPPKLANNQEQKQKQSGQSKQEQKQAGRQKQAEAEPQNSPQSAKENKNGNSSPLSDKTLLVGGHGYGGENLQGLQEQEITALLSPYISVMSQRIKGILQEREATRYNGGKKSGKLLNGNAYKIALNETRIFSRKTTPNNPKSKVFIVLDCSGSMNGERERQTFIGALFLKEIFKKLNFDINFYGFNDSFFKIENLNRYGSFIEGGTNDEMMLTELNKKLNNQDNNLIFIFTDGNSGYAEPKIIIDSMVAHKNAVIMGIGFGSASDMVAKYPASLLLPDSSQLLTELYKKLKLIIHR